MDQKGYDCVPGSYCVPSFLLCYNPCRSLWPPKLCSVSVWSLVYTLKYLIFTLKSLLFTQKSLLFTPISVFLVSIVPIMYAGRSSYAVFIIYPIRVCTRCADEGWGHVGGKTNCTGVSTKLCWRTIYCTNMRPDPKYTYYKRSNTNVGSTEQELINIFDHKINSFSISL